MRKVTLDFYSDPGHAWVKFPMSKLYELGIQNKISTYSYRRNNTAYLEEDMDASILIEKLKELGITFKVREFNTNKYSKIRSYRHYHTN